MKELVLLLKKDLKIEFRTKEVLILQITMALLLSTVCAAVSYTHLTLPTNREV